MSKLYFKYGAMNSGKTTILIQTAHNYESLEMKVIVIKPSKDIKGEETIISRVGLSRKVDYLIKDNDNIYELIKNNHGDIKCLLVDEVQFFQEKQIDQLLMISSILDIPVICYGLRTDFQMKGFKGSSRLLLLADKIEEIKTICKCGKKATLNVRKQNNKYIFEGKQVAIDGIDSIQYESICPSCLYKLKQK